MFLVHIHPQPPSLAVTVWGGGSGSRQERAAPSVVLLCACFIAPVRLDSCNVATATGVAGRFSGHAQSHLFVFVVFGSLGSELHANPGSCDCILEAPLVVACCGSFVCLLAFLLVRWLCALCNALTYNRANTATVSPHCKFLVKGSCRRLDLLRC